MAAGGRKNAMFHCWLTNLSNTNIIWYGAVLVMNGMYHWKFVSFFRNVLELFQAGQLYNQL
jgi:hypothetical protein